jgi:hypothetical protein
MFVPTKVLPTTSIGFRHILGLKSTMRWSTKGTKGKEMSTSRLYDAGYSSEAGVSNPRFAMSCYAAIGNICKFIYMYYKNRGPGSVVGISDWLLAGLSGDRIPVGARFSAPVQTDPGAHLASCTMGIGSLPGVKSGQGVTLTTHPLLVPWSWKERAIPLLPLQAARPVQNLSACIRGALYLQLYYKNQTIYIANFVCATNEQAHNNGCRSLYF